ncbi:MAG: [Fe-Fe] hydrogenase large subunit C-terminal domain-containing protein [Candidatus Micrarchaeia archaeon]|jgi:NADH-quinone oxidoreductase subunit G/NADP-reducing hydrogenase subunit HndD
MADFTELEKALSDKNLTKVIQVAPAVRVAIGEPFGYAPGTVLTKKLVGALRKLGFDYVFDTNFTADLVVLEESAELDERIKKGGPFPLLNSCCPGFALFLEQKHPDLFADYMSTTKSPMEAMGALIRTYFAQKKGLDAAKIYSVAAMPCLIKKLEAKRPDMKLPDGKAAVDFVITTKEISELMKAKGIELKDCIESDFDSLMALSSGAARIFGTTGGVSEAALRYYASLNGISLGEPVVTGLRGFDNVRELAFDLGGTPVKILVVHYLKNAGPILADKALREQYNFIEVMACQGGCMGGAGQPLGTPEILQMRRKALFDLDANSEFKISNQNPELKQLYAEFLGEIGGKKAKELLHTRVKE